MSESVRVVSERIGTAARMLTVLVVAALIGVAVLAAAVFSRSAPS